MQPPKLRDKIYSPPMIYVTRGEGDFLAGLCTVEAGNKEATVEAPLPKM